MRLELRPRRTFKGAPKVERRKTGIAFKLGRRVLSSWASFPLEVDATGVSARLALNCGEEAWVVFGLDAQQGDWSIERCRGLHEATNAYWHRWTAQLKHFSFAQKQLQRSAITVHLLAHAPNDAVVAAVTTSLPERIGGDRNYDYRYTWVRDASLSAAFLAIVGATSEVGSYFDWLCKLESEVDAPLQVCYRTDGQTRLALRKQGGVEGYRGSQPVTFGNRAYKQHQLGSLGWFADSALIFLECGGEWKPEYGKLLHRAADYICTAWRQPDSGVWELSAQAQYVASKVMAWVTLDRALRIAERTGEDAPASWEQARAAIRAEVLDKGWSEQRRSFLQRYDADALDAATLLIPLMGFLPPDDARVLASIEAIETHLLIDGLVHRFDPTATLGGPQLSIERFEGGFLPATFWYAHALAGAGRSDQARAVLQRCEAIAAGPGIFAEEADGRDKTFLGNTPLLLSQVEYGRALLALQHSESVNATATT